jgi:hypothetical protein
MKRTVVVLLSLLSLILLAGCSQPVSAEDNASIQMVLKTYYDALNSYDADRVEEVFTEETWITDGWKFRSYIQWALKNSAEIEYVSIKEVDMGRDTARVTVEVQSDQIPGDESYRLVRNSSGWQLTALLTEKFDGLSGKLFYTPGLPSAKCACQ